MTAMDPTLFDRIAALRPVELSHELHEGIPTSPSHPGFRMFLARRHGDRVREDGGSSANEVIITGGHVGTHVDALAHVSHEGLVHGGLDCAQAQSGGRLGSHGAETIPPLLTRGVLLDIPALTGRDRCAAGEAIGADLLEAAAADAAPRPGEVVLIRTGWARFWETEHDRYLGQTEGAPGPDVSGARWIAERRVAVAGADTTAFEQIPPGRGHATMPVHRILLVEHGIHILEHLDLEDLHRAGVREFLFAMLPLRIRGGTGSPVRPLALVEGSATVGSPR